MSQIMAQSTGQTADKERTVYDNNMPLRMTENAKIENGGEEMQEKADCTEAEVVNVVF